jgi:DNA-binding CsgD family transcriptional regulator
VSGDQRDRPGRPSGPPGSDRLALIQYKSTHHAGEPIPGTHADRAEAGRPQGRGSAVRAAAAEMRDKPFSYEGIGGGLEQLPAWFFILLGHPVPADAPHTTPPPGFAETMERITAFRAKKAKMAQTGEPDVPVPAWLAAERSQPGWDPLGRTELTDDDAPGHPPGLSADETRVLAHLPGRLTAAQIGARLGMPAETVKAHIEYLSAKLGVTRRADAVTAARAAGLLPASIEPPGPPPPPQPPHRALPADDGAGPAPAPDPGPPDQKSPESPAPPQATPTGALAEPDRKSPKSPGGRCRCGCGYNRGTVGYLIAHGKD